jgi:Fibrobacter succinogenes major domain (Fib_succ_major)
MIHESFVNSKVKYASKIIVMLKIKCKIMKQKFLLFAMSLLFIVWLYIPASYSQSPCPNVATVDYAGKTYNTIAIGDQCWLKENLDVGTQINGSDNQSDNGTIEKYCANDDPANCATYGGLYQWKEAMQYVTTSGTKGICPIGWHIPTNAELQTLGTKVSNDGNALKAVG